VSTKVWQAGTEGNKGVIILSNFTPL